jgi:predicted MFS family arabinose efflux permease
MAGGAKSKHPYIVLLTHSDFPKFFAAGAASAGGLGVTGVCMTWLVYSATGSAWAIAFLAIATAVSATAFNAISGVLVDRYSRRRLMMGSDATRAAVVAGLALSVLLIGVNLAIFVVATILLTVLTGLFVPAESTLLPRLISPEQLPDANGLLSSSQIATGIAGTVIAGVLIDTTGSSWGLWAAVATFSISTVLIREIRASQPDPPKVSALEPTGGGFLRDLREGAEWLFGHHAILGFTLSSMAFNFFSTISLTFLVFYATVSLGGTGLLFAVLIATTGIGGAMGSLAVGRFKVLRRAGLSWIASFGFAGGLSVLVLGVFRSVPLAIVALLAFGLSSAFSSTVWVSVSQLAVPSQLQGRVLGFDSLLSVVLLPIAALLGALLVKDVGTSETYFISGIAWVVAAVFFLLWKDFRDFQCDAKQTVSLPET